MWLNGTRTQNYTYNAANQVTGWSYDAAGNLLNDGTQSYTYDALSRVLSVGSTTNQSNADGTLVAQTQGSTTTRYTQDFAAPLSQIFSDGTQRYVYGTPAERLYGVAGSTRTWYSVDALNSVRALFDDAGIPQAEAKYDAWGVPETPLIGSFGFTSALQRGSDVWLRARWYGAGRGSFGSRDPYQGDAETPYSVQYYQYGYSNPVSLRDPSGYDPHYCESLSYEKQGVCYGQHESFVYPSLTNVRIYYLNQIGNKRGVISPNAYSDDFEGYIILRLKQTVGFNKVSHIPVYDPDTGTARGQMYKELLGNRDLSSMVAQTITRDIHVNPLHDGERIVLVGNSGGGTLTIGSLPFFENDHIFIDQVIVRGSPVQQ